MNFKRRNTKALANLICGNLGSPDQVDGKQPSYFPYRSSMYIAEFFRDLDTEWGTTARPATDGSRTSLSQCWRSHTTDPRLRRRSSVASSTS